MNPLLSDVLGSVVMLNHYVYGGCLVWSWMPNFLDSYYLFVTLGFIFFSGLVTLWVLVVVGCFNADGARSGAFTFS